MPVFIARTDQDQRPDPVGPECPFNFLEHSDDPITTAFKSKLETECWYPDLLGSSNPGYFISVDGRRCYGKISRKALKRRDQFSGRSPKRDTPTTGKPTGFVKRADFFLTDHFHLLDKNLFHSVATWQRRRRSALPDCRREARVLQAWCAAGIRTPHVVAADSEILITEFIPGESYLSALAKGFDDVLHAKVCDQLVKIQTLSRTTRDSELLMTDTHLGNFFVGAAGDVYVMESGQKATETKPLRSGKAVASPVKFNISHMIARQSLKFLRASMWVSSLDDETRSRFVSMYLSRLPAKDLETMLKAARPRFSRRSAYFSLRSLVLAVLTLGRVPLPRRPIFEQRPTRFAMFCESIEDEIAIRKHRSKSRVSSARVGDSEA